MVEDDYALSREEFYAKIVDGNGQKVIEEDDKLLIKKLKENDELVEQSMLRQPRI
jgi:hypothetical protein